MIQGSLADVLRVPNALEVIEVEAFYGDNSLDEVVLPEGVVSIGSRAFLNSSLKKINLLGSLTFIASDSFDGPEEVSVTANVEHMPITGRLHRGTSWPLRRRMHPKAGPEKLRSTGTQWKTLLVILCFMGLTTVLPPQLKLLSGDLTPKATGSATITVSTDDGNYTATCKVTVSTATVSVTGVSLDKSNTTLIVGGGTETLTATVSPSNATNKTVSWTSSNTSVVTVSNSGVLTPKAAGSATITVSTNDGNHKATCSVTVKTGLGISEHPTNQTAEDGSNVTMRVTAIGGTGSYSYQWYRASSSTATGSKVSTSQNYSFTASSSYNGMLTAERLTVS